MIKRIFFAILLGGRIGPLCMILTVWRCYYPVPLTTLTGTPIVIR